MKFEKLEEFKTKLEVEDAVTSTLIARIQECYVNNIKPSSFLLLSAGTNIKYLNIESIQTGYTAGTGWHTMWATDISTDEYYFNEVETYNQYGELIHEFTLASYIFKGSLDVLRVIQSTYFTAG